MHYTAAGGVALPNVATPRDPTAAASPHRPMMSRHPQLAEAVAVRITTWGPPKPLTSEERLAWDASADTAREWVAVSVPVTPAAASTRLWGVSRLTIWAHMHLGTLDPAVVVTDHNIQHLIAVVAKTRSEGWRHCLRSVLCRVGRAVNPAGFDPQPPVIGRSAVPKPYTPEDEAAFILDVSMPGRANRVPRAATALLSLAAGARGTAIALAGPQDLVTHRDGRVSVRLGGPDPRQVPIRAAYTDLAQWVARECRSTRFVTATNRSAVSNTARRITGSDGQGLSLRRARATWLAAHLAAATPLAALRKLAGPVGGPTLTALLDHTSAQLDTQTALEMGWGA